METATDFPRLLPVDLQEKRQEWLEDQFTIWADAEARPWRKTEAGGYEPMPDIGALELRLASPRRTRLGVWGAYGDKPVIIAYKDDYGRYQTREHPTKRYSYYEILNRPVKRKTWYP